MAEPENGHDKSDVEDNRKEGGTAAERVLRNRDYKARSLLAYLRSEDLEVDVDADGQILVVPEAKLESMPDLQDAVRDLAPELLQVVQEEIARLLVETWYPCPAAGPSYAARPTVDEVLASVREYWPDDAVYAHATCAGALFRAAWTAARELECHTGYKPPRREVGDLLSSGLTTDDSYVRGLAAEVEEGWGRAGPDNPPPRPALEKLRRLLAEEAM